MTKETDQLDFFEDLDEMIEEQKEDDTEEQKPFDEDQVQGI